ncbi:hypothetical protein AKJ65_02905 [candidate division MSBL1 archaeon SCGC-AAA259E19]|uniref:S-methyl-5-thioribose-1-phosphate isomerase n=1 Tax=candidate division MSBL1 archaeon SCGC-AAA259E19 TaxID=1698264 RepID=A0A133ULA0_9EURY|nr:hypothetical protein AKJ65_02905 [candidate division MSBL1 archaeon SCGC-AAA259E19]
MDEEDLPILVDLHSNVYFDDEEGEVVILDRRTLPEKVSEYRCENYEEVAGAIEKMVTQSLGVSPAAGYGVAIAAYKAREKSKTEMKNKISEAVERMKNTRPTQTSLHYLVDEMAEIARERIEGGKDVFKAVRSKAYEWTDHLMNISRKLGKYCSELLDDGDTILTHCYGGPAIFFMGSLAREDGKDIDYYCSETRPYLQGARLTSFALNQGNFDVTLVTDGMPAHCMRKGLIDKFITGADRISLDGGVANKIGTYQISLAAKRHGIPFYAISYTGPDPETPTYRDVEVEKRDPKEVIYFRENRISPEGVNAYYPAFDCTPPELVKGIVTDKGVYSPESVSQYFDR